MIYLEVCFHTSVHKVPFNSMDHAKAELDRLQPLIGKWTHNESDTHTVKAPTGDFVVVLSKVEGARILDLQAWENMHAEETEAAYATQIDREIKLRRALNDAGVAKFGAEKKTA